MWGPPGSGSVAARRGPIGWFGAAFSCRHARDVLRGASVPTAVGPKPLSERASPPRRSPRRRPVRSPCAADALPVLPRRRLNPSRNAAIAVASSLGAPPSSPLSDGTVGGQLKHRRPVARAPSPPRHLIEPLGRRRHLPPLPCVRAPPLPRSLFVAGRRTLCTGRHFPRRPPHLRAGEAPNRPATSSEVPPPGTPPGSAVHRRRAAGSAAVAALQRPWAAMLTGPLGCGLHARTVQRAAPGTVMLGPAWDSARWPSAVFSSSIF
jgi:hypothetical protein